MMTLALALVAAIVPPAQAGGSETPCPAQPAPLPAALAGWSARMPVTAGRDATAVPALTLGRGAGATLVADPVLRYARAPGKAPAPGTFGGLFAVTIVREGRYRIALDKGAWIDVIRGDQPLRSVAHDHGPACSSIRKIVDFDLIPGRYLVQIAGSPSRALGLMVVAAGG